MSNTVSRLYPRRVKNTQFWTCVIPNLLKSPEQRFEAIEFLMISNNLMHFCAEYLLNYAGLFWGFGENLKK